jgi:hypothetical protein
MAEKRAIGLLSIELGAIAGDGGIATTFASLGVTYQDSAELMQADNNITEIFSEENDDAEEVIEVMGGKTLKWSVMNIDPDNLVLILGGTATGTAPNKTWEAPDTRSQIEKSVRVKTKTNQTIDIPRAKIMAKINWKFSKKGVALIDITAKVLKPTKAGVASLKIYPSV